MTTEREFAKIAAGGAALLAPPALVPHDEADPQVSNRRQWRPTDPENLLYLKQLGVTWVSLGASPANAPRRLHENPSNGKRAVFKVYNIAAESGQAAASQHGRGHAKSSGRDKKIEEYLNYIRYLGKAASLTALTLIWATASGAAGAKCCRRLFSSTLDLSSPDAKGIGRKDVWNPLSHGRVSRRGDLETTRTSSEGVPVAEEAGVRIGIHPDDPRSQCWRSPRCIFSNFEGYKRAIEIATVEHRRVPVLWIVA